MTTGRITRERRERLNPPKREKKGTKNPGGEASETGSMGLEGTSSLGKKPPKRTYEGQI